MATYENDVLIQTKDKNGNIHIHYPITTGANVLMADGQTAEDVVNDHIADKSNPHGVTAAQVGAVPTTRKVNNKALNADITLSASDVGAAESEHGHAASEVTGLATVATSGSYNDLSNKPTIPTTLKNPNKLTIKGAGTSVESYDGSAVGEVDIVAGSNVTVTGSDGKITVSATDTVYTHPTTSGNKHIPSGGSSGQILRWSADGTAAWGADNNTTYSEATTSAAGLMSATDKSKLDGIATGANKTTVDSALSSTSTNPVQNKVINTALSGKSDSGHGHDAATTSAAGFMSAADKTKLNGIATGANAYTHPTTAGNKHIPSGGSSKQILEYSASGTAKWSNVTDVIGYTPMNSNLKGAANGLAELDSNGKVPSSQLPSYVDDVIEGTYVSATSFKNGTTAITGEAGKIYVDTTSGKTYRWSGSAFVEISSSLALGETSSTAYRGDRGKTAYEHSQITSGNPHGTTKTDLGLGDVENKSSATIRGELTKSNVTTALGYTPPTKDTTYGVVSTTADGLAPKRTGTTTKFLRDDGTWAVPPDTNTVYTHPTTSGNKHIPSGGSSGQILRWSADGTAAWGADNNTTYGVVSTTADGLAPKRDGSTTKFLRADGTWAVPPDNDTKYTLPNATSSTLGGVKIGSNISVSSGTISVPTASGTTAGVTVVWPAAQCTTFSSDSGTVTPLAVQKGAKMFSITRPSSSTNKAITRYSNTTGDVQDSKIIIEDVTNSRDTSKTAQVIAIPAEGGKKMVYGYCTDQIDGTSFIGGVFDADATAYPYSEGLAIGGTSGNLLWKGAKVATVNDIPSTSSLAPKASPTFTGTPKAPTAAAGTNTTQIATTAFVQAAISAMQATIDSLTARIAALEADDITFEESEV